MKAWSRLGAASVRNFEDQLIFDQLLTIVFSETKMEPKFRDLKAQERLNHLRQRHGVHQVRVSFLSYGQGQGLWAEWGKKNSNLTEFPNDVVAVLDEKAAE